MEKRLVRGKRVYGRVGLRPVFGATFLFSLHYFFVLYINSTYISKAVSTETLGVLYIMGAALTIVLFVWTPHLLARLGNYQLLLLFLIFEIIGIAGLAFAQSAGALIAFFILHQAIPPLMLFSLDIFVEHATKNAVTGHIRSYYNTIINGTVVISPLIVGFLLKATALASIYKISLVFLALFAVIVILKFRHYRDAHYREYPLATTAKELFVRKKILLIFIADILLQFFYATMVIYMPLYLSQTIGFSWRDIGIIFGIMLLPFILDEIPLGAAADRWIGEKEILIAGFAIAAVSTLLIPYLGAKSIAAWAMLLFATRVGASFIEIAAETYFFKQLSDGDSQLISVFRMAIPLSYIFAPLAASVILIYGNMTHVFTMLGLAMVLGFLLSLKLVDTQP